MFPRKPRRRNTIEFDTDWLATRTVNTMKWLKSLQPKGLCCKISTYQYFIQKIHKGYKLYHIIYDLQLEVCFIAKF